MLYYTVHVSGNVEGVSLRIISYYILYLVETSYVYVAVNKFLYYSAFTFGHGLDLASPPDLDSLENFRVGRQGDHIYNSFKNRLTHGRTAYLIIFPCM